MGPLELLLVVTFFGVWIWALVDVLMQPSERFSGGVKGLWVLAIIVLPLLGALAYFLIGRPRPRLG